MNKIHSFHYLLRHVGKGEREGIKRIHEVDENNRIISTHVDWESIENKLIEYNEAHFTKAYDTIVYRDKIYNKLRDDHVRDKILAGNLNREECDDERMYQFLKLLKKLEMRRNHKEITMVDWERVVK